METILSMSILSTESAMILFNVLACDEISFWKKSSTLFHAALWK